MSQAGKGEEERAEHARSHRGALKSCSNGNCFVKTANCQLACCLRVLGGEEKRGGSGSCGAWECAWKLFWARFVCHGNFK